MNKIFLIAFLFICAVGNISYAREIDFGKKTSIQLYQADSVVSQRTTPEDLSAYIKNIENIIFPEIYKTQIDENYDLVIAIKESNEAKFWFICHDKCALNAHSKEIIESIKSVSVPKLKGKIVFAIKYRTDGKPTSDVPYPDQWQNIVKAANKPLTIDNILDKVWQ